MLKNQYDFDYNNIFERIKYTCVTQQIQSKLYALQLIVVYNVSQKKCVVS